MDSTKSSGGHRFPGRTAESLCFRTFFNEAAETLIHAAALSTGTCCICASKLCLACRCCSAATADDTVQWKQARVRALKRPHALPSVNHFSFDPRFRSLVEHLFKRNANANLRQKKLTSPREQKIFSMLFTDPLADSLTHQSRNQPLAETDKIARHSIWCLLEFRVVYQQQPGTVAAASLKGFCQLFLAWAEHHLQGSTFLHPKRDLAARIQQGMAVNGHNHLSHKDQ